MGDYLTACTLDLMGGFRWVDCELDDCSGAGVISKRMKT